MNERDDVPAQRSANPEFALHQLLKAIGTSEAHPDAETRERARAKVARWLRTLGGMAAGTLDIGARTPILHVPTWATPEVTYGGFVTGELLAGGERLPHEHRLHERVGGPAARGSGREHLNAWYLSPAGLTELLEELESGHYRIEVPEEGALLAVAWLLRRGDTDAAARIVDEIRPYFPGLRFYPVPAAEPPDVSEAVHLHSVGDARRRLEAVRTPLEVARQRETVTIWLPLYDRMLAHFAETVSGDLPVRRPDGGIDGGWPCQHYPAGWTAGVHRTLGEIARGLRVHRLCRRPLREDRYFPRLRRHLRTALADPTKLEGRAVGEIRGMLADVNAKRGLPGSARCRALREAQAAGVARPAPVDFARLLSARMVEESAEGGLDTDRIADLTKPVTANEGRTSGLPPEAPIPPELVAKVRTCLHAPVETLLEHGILTSSESLAGVVTHLAARTQAAAFPDASLAGLAQATYTAFRRRRSLLLLNLESQVRFEELPWVDEILPYRRDDAWVREAARRTLERIVALALTAYPQTLLPNKLLQEIRALAAEAGLDLPITDELAADIFMGAFTAKFVRAARTAASLLAGTLYETYYDISYDRVRRLQVPRTTERGPGTSKAFLLLCERRAKADRARSFSVARNGTIIEQQQILTTHNLAVLFGALGLAEALSDRLVDLARVCFAWICRRQQMRIEGWQQRLQMMKNTAYAWRQMIFFLSLRPREEQRAFVRWAQEHLEARTGWFALDFQPALTGLELAVDGREIPSEGRDGGDREARRFLGWTTGRHWLMGGE